LLVRTPEAAGQIDILISNPALSRRAPFPEYPPELFEQTIAGTLTSGFHMGQLVAQGGSGRIVFISSMQAELPTALSGPYSAAKAGLKSVDDFDRRRADSAPQQRQRDRTRLDRHTR
jgi:NAD(P)-dependent dehydrogenase (short-subunit alcohol dehydrogenase family)